MGYRNIKIDSNIDLHIVNQQLVLGEFDGIKIPLEDINSILIENMGTKVSSYFLQKVAELGIVLYICDEKHMPNTVLLPMSKHSRHFKMLKMQVEINKPLQKRLWQQIVMKKVENQAKCLELMGVESYYKLNNMAKMVQTGDKTHVEAKAAAFYFKNLFGQYFSRDEEHIINSALNYSYAIIRGMVARDIVCYGFEPSLGLFHHSELNAFNLADDFMEPFRPIVDLYVARKFDYANWDKGLTPQIKKELFSIINYDMIMKGEKHLISNCIDKMVGSFGACLMGKREEILLPELIELQAHRYE